jgi:hypothetical protein
MRFATQAQGNIQDSEIDCFLDRGARGRFSKRKLLASASHGLWAK